MNSIGGYFELELRKGEEYHQEAIHLNTGRNALAFILTTRKYSKVFIPYYTCDVILEPLVKFKVNYEFYSIDENFEPIINYSLIKADEGFLYINYFGLKDGFINNLAENCRNLIIDNSQAFYSKPLSGIDTFYSARKFFGVPDGSYLYMKDVNVPDFPLDIALNRFGHLLKRIEYGAEAGYNDFKMNDQKLTGQPIKHMSNLTRALLCNIDYEFVKRRRINNFLVFHKHFSDQNGIKIVLDKDTVPMVYPLLSNQIGLKHFLINKNIFVATYWLNVLKWVKEESLEYQFANKIIPLPLDQRIEKKEIYSIIKTIELFL